jgi:hypothetical protein
MSGIIAREVAENMPGDESEEVFICSMFHNLGKHLVLFYFEEEYAQIVNLMESKGISEESAARSVLGMTYEDIGVNDSRDVRFQKRIPEWYSKNIFAPAFVLYPLAVNKKVLGLFYADREESGEVLTGNEVNYMKTLCNQAILAIKQTV